jgi:hypothetical protein
MDDDNIVAPTMDHHHFIIPRASRVSYVYLSRNENIHVANTNNDAFLLFGTREYAYKLEKHREIVAQKWDEESDFSW